MDATVLRVCLHCGAKYDWRRSGSRWLKLTVCGVMCERGHLDGQTIESLLAARVFRPVAEWPENLLGAIREASS